MYPFTLNTIKNLVPIAVIINLFENPKTIIHGLFLLYKC
jgi:hypothetical protein